MCDEDFIPFSLPASVIHPLLFSVGWKFNGSLWAVHIIKISFNLCGTDCGWEPHSKKERHKSYFLTRGFLFTSDRVRQQSSVEPHCATVTKVTKHDQITLCSPQINITFQERCCVSNFQLLFGSGAGKT